MEQINDNACSLFMEDFSAFNGAPNALLDDEWKCRSCKKLGAGHSRRPLQQQQQQQQQPNNVASLVLPDTSEALLRFKAEQAEVIQRFCSVHIEPDKDRIYIERTQTMSHLETELQCIGQDLDAMKAMEMQKVNCHTLEYATISGAGKSRFVLRELGKPRFHDIPMTLVALNFNGGSGGGSDTSLITSSTTTAVTAMSRLLLSRGLFSTPPSMLFVTRTGQPVPDSSLPGVTEVIDALFADRFKDPSGKHTGEGLLVVHLDELWLLKEKRDEIWIRDFIAVLLEYTLQHSNKGRYILPIVTHTCPDNNLLLNPDFNNNLFSPKSLQLHPLTLPQSMEILRWKRNNVGRGPHADDIDWHSWENAVALAGGHPGLLLQCFNSLTDNNRGVELNASTEAAVCVGLMSTERMKKFSSSVAALKQKPNGRSTMVNFVTDCLLLKAVPFATHATCLRIGLGWFDPSHTRGISGRVSSPFPLLIHIMANCDDGKYSTIGTALDPLAPGFSPTKAMEYVSALAVLLNRSKSIDLWRDCAAMDAFSLVERATEDFFTVWKLGNQAVLDFGGLLSGWKILGQSKMQEPGTQTTQALSEVLDAAWKIGNRVRAKDLTGKLHAYWVSSRRSQKMSMLQMRFLIHSFRVAMSGIVSKADAIESIRQEKREAGITDPTTNVYDLMKFLQGKRVSDDHRFTYVGNIIAEKAGDGKKKVKESDCDDGSLLQISDLLPKGVFAGWG